MVVRDDGLGRRILGECIDFLLPQHCAACGRFGASLHAECIEAFPRALGPRCVRCWRPGPGTWCERCASGGSDAPAFDALRTPFRFEGDVRRVVLEAKFRGVTAHLGPLARTAAASVSPEWRIDAVTGVPLASGRQRRRGYNQASMLARGVAAALDVRTRADLVRRVR
ncbi:MAG: hypothetical protein WD800_03065, partial [Dehalococcoidia bacterium]